MPRKDTIVRNFEYDPNDLIVAFNKVAKVRYGDDAISGVPIRKFWKHTELPLTFATIKTSHQSQVVAAVGGVRIAKIPASFAVADGGPKLAAFDVLPEHRSEILEFFDAIAAHLAHESIYRNKAIMFPGGFLDLTKVSEDDIVYNEKVVRDLRAHVWSVIEYPKLCDLAKAGLPRRILFDGPFGSGKTIAAYLTAQKALAHGWTFFYVAPTTGGSTTLARDVFAVALHYQKAVVFIEDIDREQRSENASELGAIMTMIDGVLSKGSQILVILTTNYSDRIAPGMMRPGRIDKIVDFRIFTTHDIERLLKRTLPPDWLHSSVCWERVTSKCVGFAPAFVNEVARAAALLAISESNGNPPCITEEMLVESAEDLRRQHERSNVAIGFR